MQFKVDNKIHYLFRIILLLCAGGRAKGLEIFLSAKCNIFVLLRTFRIDFPGQFFRRSCSCIVQ